MPTSQDDIIDRLISLLRERVPGVAEQPGLLDDVAAEVRAELGGQRVYVRRDLSAQRRRQARKVLAVFNGSNPYTTARELGVGVATVYRCIKQAGSMDEPADAQTP